MAKLWEGKCGQIANLPCSWQVGNLPHGAVVFDRGILANIKASVRSKYNASCAKGNWPTAR